jgi:putative transposase
MDNGSEMTSAKSVSWADQRSIGLRYIQPGKPNQNAFVERFNQSVRQEVHNDWQFDSMGQGPMIIGEWRIEYNTVRSHESLVRMRRKRSCLGSLTLKSLLLTCLLYGEV